MTKNEKILVPQCLSNLVPLKKGFTLAEVLITLGIIGIVAAMTIPTLVAQNQQRAWDKASSIFNRRLGEALSIMNSQQSLAGHQSTRSFLNELSKHIKITKICDSDRLTNCFIDEITAGNDIIKTAALKESININKYGDYATETLGVQFTDGISALIAYNPNATQNALSNQVIKFYYTNYSSGGEYSSDYATNSRMNSNITLSTDAISILYDVSGYKKPNTYTYSSEKDIRGINISLLSDVCTSKLSDGTCINTSISINPVDCSIANSSSKDYKKYCGNPSGHTADFWAGANKACARYGMRLPTIEELESLKNSEWEGKPTHGDFWTSHQYGKDEAWCVYFAGPTMPNAKYIVNNKLMCIK